MLIVKGTLVAEGILAETITTQYPIIYAEWTGEVELVSICVGYGYRAVQTPWEIRNCRLDRSIAYLRIYPRPPTPSKYPLSTIHLSFGRINPWKSMRSRPPADIARVDF